MKLFMEINPQLFDDCSHEYTEQQNSAAARENMRQRKWQAIAEQANQRRLTNGANGRGHSGSVSRPGDIDPASDDNQKRLDSLKLQDGDRRERLPALHERQPSTGSARSGR